MSGSTALFTALLQDLEQVVGPIDLSVDVPPESDGRVMACHYLARSFLKKELATTADADDAAIAKFLSVNQRMRDFTIPSNLSEHVSFILSNLKYNVYRDMYKGQDCILNTSTIFQSIDVGPGASVHALDTSFYSKVGISRMSSTTTGLNKLYEEFISTRPRWQSAENCRRSIVVPVDVVEGSKLSTVPKNREISRTICTEPLLNMMFQKGIGACFEQLLDHRYGIRYSGEEDIPNGILLQPAKNGELARLGSKSGMFATIDLSSASDSVSLSLIDWLFPKEVSGWLRLTRSPVTTLPTGESVALHMVASMGNGFTFPLQTYIFTSIVRSVYELLDINIEYPRGKRLGNFGVFGDDIIVETRAVHLVLETLSVLGFLPNVEKTFTHGPFRESCGYDYHLGVNVRPVFLKKFSSLQDKFSLMNRLMEWSTRHRVLLPHTLSCFRKILGPKLVCVPPSAPEEAGFRVPLSIALENGVKNVLHKDYCAHGFLYDCYEPQLSYVQVGDGFILGGLPFNYDALVLALLRGNLRDGRYNPRMDFNFRKRKRYTPTWCRYLPGQAFDERWVTLTWTLAAD
jgi:hypothetical protein